MKILNHSPSISKEELKVIKECLDEGWVSSAGPYVERFQKDLEKTVSNEKANGYAACVVNGTCAIHAALELLKIGPGDEVILPSLTFIASRNAIFHAGAIPAYIDSDRDTWQMDPKEVEKAITPRTKAILPVHLFGNACDLDPILEIAKAHKLHVIEDAAEALGSTYQGVHCGLHGNLGILSFNGNKIVTTGGGGAIITQNENLRNRALELTNQGRLLDSGEYDETIVGYNYRLTSLQAAFGIAQLTRFQEFMESKKRIFNQYQERLSKHSEIKFQEILPNSTTNHWLVSFTFEGKSGTALREKTLKHLISQGIQARRIFQPNHQLNAPKAIHLASKAFHSATDIYERGLSLPSSSSLTEKDVDWICNEIEKYL